MSTDPIERAVADVAAGRAVVVVDDAERENEGDLVFAASRANARLLAFTIRHTSGVVCVPMDGWMLDRLHIPLMTPHNRERMQTAYTVSVDARDGTSTGISAADRARTIQVLANPATEPDEVVQPGHVFPLRYHPGGVLVRRGHTEAAVDLARLAGLSPAGVIAELVADDGSMLRGEPLRSFADTHGLTVIRIAELARYRRRHERLVEQVAMTRLPTGHGTFRAYAYRDRISGVEHLALATGDVAGPDVLVRVHSECLTGDALGSLRCDCGPQLQEALRAIRAAGRGVVVYLRGHEGRGIGLVPKLAAYELQDGGADTVDANIRLGLPVDARDFGTAAQVLRDLGVSTVRLLTNNPAKCVALRGYGLPISERVGMPTYVTPDNLRYLRTKRDRMGHDLPTLDHPASNHDAR